MLERRGRTGGAPFFFRHVPTHSPEIFRSSRRNYRDKSCRTKVDVANLPFASAITSKRQFGS
jgi:hypothetical protein